MRVGHISDIHIGVGASGPTPLSRFQDIEKILDWTADKLIEEKVDLCLICGDLYKDAKVMFDRGTEETICVGNWLRKLSSAGIEVIVISGTPGHDSHAGYKFLEQMQIPHISIRTKPGIISYIPDLNIACLPGLNRSALLTQDEYKGLPPEQIHRIMTDKITQLCMGMAAQMPDDKPKILMAHMTYQGAETGFTDLLMQHEPILTREAVSGFDLVCLGHIHRPQIIDDKVFYSGPIERLSFNEEGINPGFWIHEVESNLPFGRLLPSRFIETPARRYVTLDLINYLASDHFALDIQDAIVRLHYSCSEEFAQQLSRKQIEKSLYDAGAWYIAEIRATIKKTERSRNNQVTENLGPMKALTLWCKDNSINDDETTHLLNLTNSLMMEVN